MDFYTTMHNTYLESNSNISITENGAVGYSSTGKELLDLNFAVASLRGCSEEEIAKRFARAYYDNKLLAMKWLFFARDIRGGLGERRLFRACLKWLAQHDPDMLRAVIFLIPEYGRFDDYWELLDYDNDIRNLIVGAVGLQLALDLEGRTSHKPISLLAKWLPSINTSSTKTRTYAKLICKGLGISQKDYRKTLSNLRSYLDIVEKKMSSNNWTGINYETVPSRANLIYKNAFLRNDEERRKNYLDSLARGEAKINSSVLFPHDIVHKYMDGSGWSVTTHSTVDQTLESLWKALPDLIEGNSNTMVVADGSGSMLCNLNGSTATALDVANALAIYFAEHASGPYHNRYITFSEHPQFVDFSYAENLREKISIALQHDECANTNIEAVFDLILVAAQHYHLRQDDIPANVLIISDMEFDRCAISKYGYYADENLFSVIRKRFEDAGYKLPRLIFWNVNSRTQTIPVRENELGVALVSGFSVNICKMVMSGKTDPFECLLETLNSERYQPVEDAIKGA